MFESAKTGQQLNSPLGSPSRMSVVLNNAIATAANGSAGTMNAHAALQRAMVGREEAETALASTLTQLQQSQVRERRISERVEQLVEEVAGVRERQIHERQVFEKEVRKARKEAFKASSVMVKCQEELKETRTELSRCRATIDRERSEKERVAQEAFERAYAVAGLVEEVEQLKEKVRSVQKGREGQDGIERVEQMLDVPKWTMHTGVQTEETLGLSSIPEQRALTTQPLRPASAQSDRHARAPETASDEMILALKKQLRWLQTLKSRDEEFIEFLEVQCQFQACPEFQRQKQMEEATARDKRSLEQLEQAAHTAPNDEATTPKAKHFTLFELGREHAANDKQDSGSLEPEPSHIIPEGVPLPTSPQLNDLSPERTAHLEDMTQVLVQPAPVFTQHGEAKTFSFSTSISSNHERQHHTVHNLGHSREFRTSIPGPRALRSQAVFDTDTIASEPHQIDEDDLFSLSPPKKSSPRRPHPPPRPSTALGLTSTPGTASRSRAVNNLIQQSPIRVVPNSPDPRSPKSPMRTVKIPGSRPKSAMSANRPGNTPATGTRRIALKGGDESAGSPVRRSAGRERARIGRSPTPVATDSVVNSEDVMATPPPVFRGPRPEEGGVVFAEMKTTTTVPLRGGSDVHTIDAMLSRNGNGDDDVFSPPLLASMRRGLYTRPDSVVESESRTMPIEMPSNANNPFPHSMERDGGGGGSNMTAPAAAAAPGTPVSRAEALRQIRERRDRARSMQLRVQKVMSMSSSQNGGASEGKGRDVSGMSAPGRM